MTTGLILIAAILVLGGAIASVGDRIGTKVGKARLSLFNLRPRKTAVLITVLTGTLISASTLAILFGASEQLRTGVFRLERIQRNLRNARKELETTKEEKSKVESELAGAKAQQAQAQQRLDLTNESLRAVLGKLNEATANQAKTESQLKQTQAQLNETQGKLNQTVSQLQETQNQLNTVSAQVMALRSEQQKLVEQRNQLQTQRQELIGQRAQLKEEVDNFRNIVAQRDRKLATKDQEIATKDQKIAAKDREIVAKDQEIAELDRKREASLRQLESQLAQRDREIAIKDQAIARYDQAIAQYDQKISLRDRVIAQRETSLKQLEGQQQELESKQAYLQRAVKVLEEYYQDYQTLREGNLVILRNQVLTTGLVRILEPKAARQAVNQLLVAANKVAIESTRPGDKTYEQQVIQITQAEVERLIDQIDDGQDYFVRIIASGNYVRGENSVQVFADVAPNKIIFQAGEVIAATSTNPATMTQDQLEQRIEQVIAASQFRARRAGILADKIQIGDGIETVGRIEKLKQSSTPIDVQVVTSDITYTAGPVKMDLVAVQGGQILFKTSPAS
jgi:uncharacterized protein (DUF3084 family)